MMICGEQVGGHDKRITLNLTVGNKARYRWGIDIRVIRKSKCDPSQLIHCEHIHPDASDKNGDEQPTGIVIVSSFDKTEVRTTEENGSVEVLWSVCT